MTIPKTLGTLRMLTIYLSVWNKHKYDTGGYFRLACTTPDMAEVGAYWAVIYLAYRCTYIFYDFGHKWARVVCCIGEER